MIRQPRVGHTAKTVALAPINVGHIKEDVMLMINVVVSWNVLQIHTTSVGLVSPPLKNVVNILVTIKLVYLHYR